MGRRLKVALMLAGVGALASACGDGSSNADGATGDGDGGDGDGGDGDGQVGGDGDGDGDDSGDGDGSMLPESELSADESWTSDFADASISVSSSDNGCTTTATDLAQSGLARVPSEDGRILYVGFAQVGANNQDPLVALVDGDEVMWCQHHEDDPPDGRAVGVSWNGGEVAYVTYTVVGGGTDLEGGGGWLDSYAPGAISGGGVKVSLVGQVDVSSGALLSSTFVIAVKMDGTVNTHNPSTAAHVLSDGSIEFLGESTHKPIGVDKATSMGCTDYPFDTRYRFSADLSTLICAESTNCDSNHVPCD